MVFLNPHPSLSLSLSLSLSQMWTRYCLISRVCTIWHHVFQKF
jgi:hypothetical protein